MATQLSWIHAEHLSGLLAESFNILTSFLELWFAVLLTHLNRKSHKSEEIYCWHLSCIRNCRCFELKLNQLAIGRDPSILFTQTIKNLDCYFYTDLLSSFLLLCKQSYLCNDGINLKSTKDSFDRTPIASRFVQSLK